MAKGYRRVDRDQAFLLPPDMREWVPADHPVHWVIDAVAQLDTAELHRQRRLGGVGRQGYDPDMLLTLLIWAWAQGQRSSRQIERLCWQDVTYRLICAGNLPDHTSIARFRQAAGAVVPDLYAQVLVLCARLGMIRLGTVALDSTKIAADASMDASLTEQGLLAAAEREAANAAAEHADADQAEDDMFGPDGRGDVVPDDPGTPSGRAERINQAIEKVRADARTRRRPADPSALRGRRSDRATPEQIAAAEQKLATAKAKQQAKIDAYQQDKAQGRPRTGQSPGPVDQVARVRHAAGVLQRVLARKDLPAKLNRRTVQPPPKCNITDPDSGLQPTRRGGWLQGYNCQAVTSQDGFIVANSVSASPADAPTYQDLINAAVAAARMLVAERPEDFPTDQSSIELVLADAGYLSRNNLTCPGPDRMIAVGSRRQLEHDARHTPAEDPAPDTSDPVQQMAHRLRTAQGISTYRQRSHIAETPFADTKHNKNFRRMTGRGLARARIDWTFNALVHNLTKASRYAT